MIRWWEHSQKNVTDRQTGGQTEWTIHRAAWSQLKIQISYEYTNAPLRIIMFVNLQHINGFLHDCSISNSLAMEYCCLAQSDRRVLLSALKLTPYWSAGRLNHSRFIMQSSPVVNGCMHAWIFCSGGKCAQHLYLLVTNGGNNRTEQTALTHCSPRDMAILLNVQFCNTFQWLISWVFLKKYSSGEYRVTSLTKSVFFHVMAWCRQAPILTKFNVAIRGL